jgi:hypothetical protein
MREGVRFLLDGAPAMDASRWRVFWRERGMRELSGLLADSWPPLAGAPVEVRESCAFRIASLLGSRAPQAALAEELGRIRRDSLELRPAPAQDEQAAAHVARWFANAA